MFAYGKLHQKKKNSAGFTKVAETPIFLPPEYVKCKAHIETDYLHLLVPTKHKLMPVEKDKMTINSPKKRQTGRKESHFDFRGNKHT